ncbi:neuromedin-U receptor 2-like isoform X2 [Anneissia japonica]|nr:neuromedin-U receptor 2-like isoform X2 [Anneissia japonica]XP_033112236.1 neuromedin-U receptor 2-like isoform X2 [Anneissia japonica]XP_033112237.1 neuromedin-U receptor 2-like isoform X2 [Anneissia japonica]XP_033112238.1 neuromedin-U receptor 2-like isoform X2 [Anneissia japonica]XP_033112239.1 neuromedin-U receptor 2-like isoform X2 [Anneissia japonica]
MSGGPKIRQNSCCHNDSYKNVTMNDTIENSDYTVFWKNCKFYTDFDKVIITIIMPIIVTIGIIGNIMTIIVIASKKCMHTPVNVYFANLAIADTLYLIVGPDLIWNSYRNSPIHNWNDIGEEMNWFCPLQKFITETALTVALFTVFWLSVERCMAVCRPLKFQRSGFRYCSRSLKICSIFWILGMSWKAQYLALLRALPAQIPWPPSVEGRFPKMLTACVIRDENIKLYRILFWVDQVLIFLILVALVVLYTAMLISLRKSRNSKFILTRTVYRPKSKPEMKVFLTAFVTVTVYVLCMTPFKVFTFLYINDLTRYFSMVNILTRLMCYINSAVNPFIYNAMNSTFRRAFGDVFCSKNNTKNRTHPLASKNTTTKFKESPAPHKQKVCLNDYRDADSLIF